MAERWKLIVEKESDYLDGISTNLLVTKADNDFRIIAYPFDEGEARLIAAAPALLEALEEALGDLEAIQEIGPKSVSVDLTTYRAAIAAAKGGGEQPSLKDPQRDEWEGE